MTANGRRSPETPNQLLMRPFFKRVFPVLGIYAISILDYHRHCRNELDSFHGHQLLMAGSLLELRQWFKT